MTKNVAERIVGKRVGLALSAGYFGFYHQAGVLVALEEHGIRPDVISGNSAGALVASMFAAGLAPTEIRDALLAVGRENFWDPQWPLSRLGFGFLAGERFRSELGRALPNHSFETCRCPLTVGVYDIETGRVRHLCKGPLIPAVYASCALPYLFEPQKIDGRRYWDGGFAEKTPLAPFISNDDIEIVVISYLPQRDANRKPLLPFIPSGLSLFADIPYEERVARDREGLRLLEAAGKEVIVLAPKPLKLGLFSLENAPRAFERGRSGAASLLASDGAALGATALS